MKPAEVTVRALDGDAELAKLGEIEGWSFGVPGADSAAWLERAGRENVRVVLARGELVGGLLLVPMGQWFGGKSVAMTGVAGVGVAAEARGRGVARALMADVIRELAEHGTPLSALYPATLPLYRSAGYELAGCRFEVEIEPARIGLLDRELSVRELGEGDFASVEGVYRERASGENGWLDRGTYIWNRVRAPRNQPARGFVVEHEGRVEGYLFARQKGEGLAYEIVLTDLCALTRRAARRLLTFLADHRSLGERVRWHAGPADPLVLELPERGAKIGLSHHWMLRIVRPGPALGARGYPLGLRAELDLEVHDTLLEERSRFRLSVEDGEARVEAGGTGALRLDVKGLAALYSGVATPRALERLGLCEGDPSVLARAASLFALPMPTMPDMF